MPAENTAQLAVGRLLEIRAAAGYKCADDVDRLFAELEAVLPGLLGFAIVVWNTGFQAVRRIRFS